MALPIAAIIAGAATQAGSNIITNVVNRKNVQDTNEQRYKLFREQLKYNDASAQMQRQMAAGLHPMTMSGLQPTDAPTAPDYETYEARNPFSGAIDAGQSMAQMMIQEKQLGLTEQEIEVQRLKTTVDALNAVTALMGENATTDEALMMLQKITGLTPTDGSTAVSLHRDEVLLNSLKNQVKMSNLSVEEKRILNSWLDSIKEAEYNLIVAQSGEVKSRDNLNRINAKVAQSIKELNESEKSHIEQLTKNLQEQWKSINFQGEFDAQMLLRLRELVGSYVKEIKNSANITEQEATYWVWNKVINAQIPGIIADKVLGDESDFGDRFWSAPWSN